MDIYDELLKDVLAEPDDDTPRLIMADWLEEEGAQPERAEFIRLQCAIAQWALGASTEPATVAEVDIWRRRARQLLGRPNIQDVPCNGYLWGEPLHLLGIQRAHWDSTWFERGFIERIELHAENWPARAAKIAAMQPVREVTLLGDWCSYAQQIAATPQTGRLRVLRLIGPPEGCVLSRSEARSLLSYHHVHGFAKRLEVVDITGPALAWLREYYPEIRVVEVS